MKTRNENRLDALYSRIPAFNCVEGCTACCGPVPFTAEEWKPIKDQRIHTCVDCPYAVVTGGCAIYDNRPLLCRLFGASDDLPCPMGAGPAQRLTSKQSKKIMRVYDEILKSTDEQFPTMRGFSLRGHLP